MNRVVATTALALLVAVAGLLWSSGESEGQEGLATPGEARQALAPVNALAPQGEGAALEEAGLEPGGQRSEIAQLPGIEELPNVQHSRVFGRITDANDTPLAGVSVRLRSVGERWISVELHPQEVPEFELQTGADGFFEFDVPLPTSTWISLSILPSEFHTKAGRSFGHAGGRNEDPLLAGDNDLGTCVLGSAGVFEGRVVDKVGAPIVGARARLDGAFPGGYSLSAKTGEGGRYRVGRVPAGRYFTEALAEGYLSAQLPVMEVHDGEVTAGVDFVLEVAPAISGIVIDEQGEPLEKARLWGWPASSGQGAGARSSADGRFTVYLPQDEPYTMGAKLAGYESFEDRRKHYEPGTTSVRIVLKKPALATYSVRDAKSDAPVERFWLRVDKQRSEDGSISSSASFESAGEASQHPGGELQLPGGPNYDYTISAPGYAPQRGRVVFADVEARRQTILLSAGGAIRGRMVSRGEPLASPSIRVEADRIPLREGAIDSEDDIFSDDWGKDLDAFAGKPRQYQGQVDGSFLIEDLAAGTYELRLSATGAAPHTVERVRVEVGETTELGDVEAAPPGEIHGTILLGGGSSARGLTVMLGSEHFADDESAQKTDAVGSFSFKGLAAGQHHLWIEAKHRVLVRGGPIAVVLADGERKDLQLDLSERVPCDLEVHVLIGGQPVSGLIVSIAAAEGRQEQPIGICDAHGVASGDVEVVEPCLLRVSGSSGLLIGESAHPVEFLRGARVREDLDFEAGELVLSCALDRETESIAGSFLSISGAGHGSQGDFVGPESWKVSAGQARAELGLIAPGRYTVGMWLGSKQVSGEVQVIAGEQAVCELQE